MKRTYVLAAVLVAVVATAGVAVAVSESARGLLKAKVHQIKWTPEGAANAARLENSRGDQSATTTDLSTIVDNPGPQKLSERVTKYQEIAETKQDGTINQHLTVDNTLRTVSFCNTEYRTRKIIINGVDVIERIAHLASTNQMGKGRSVDSIGEVVCINMFYGEFSNEGVLTATDVRSKDITGELYPENSYWLSLGAQGFSIDSVTNEIFLVEAFDGSLVGPVGKLK